MKYLIRTPFLFTVVILILFTLSLIIPPTGIFVIILGVFIIIKLKMKSLAGIEYSIPFKHKWYTLIPVYLIILGIIPLMYDFNFTGIDINDILMLLIGTLGVGFLEEIVFRGVLQSYFLKHFQKNKDAIYIGVILPSVLFGCMHLLNLTDPESDTLEVVIQVIYAIFLGVCFGAILLKTNRLLPLAIIHGLINFVYSIDTLKETKTIDPISTLDSIAPLLITFPLFIIGLWILRKIKSEHNMNTAMV